MLSDVLPHLNMLSKVFQKTSIDFSLIGPMISATQVVLQNLLDQPGDNMKQLPQQFEQLQEYGVKFDDSDLTRFNNQIYQNFIYKVIENLHDRFPDNSIVDAFTVFDPDLICKEDPSLHEFIQVEKLQKLTSHFKSVASFEVAKEEFLSLRSLIATDMKQMDLKQALHKISTLQHIYPSMSRLCQIALIIPVSTADCERSFSAMSRIKTVLRNRLSQRVLNYLMTISIEGPEPCNFNYKACVKAWGEEKKRKIATE